MSKGYIEQIRKFLIQNSSKIPRKAIKENKVEVSADNLKTTPQTGIIDYGNVKNPEGLFKKINEFNSSIEGAQKLT